MTSHHTALKVASDKLNDELIFNAPMRVSEAASLFRHPIGKNEKPYDAEVIKHNNEVVADWHRDVLLSIADSQNAIPSGRVTQCLQYFLQGRDLVQHQKYKQYLPTYSDSIVKFWLDKFQEPLSQLIDMGPGVVAAGWQVITMAIRYHFADKKWDTVYSKSTNPLQWDKLANANPHLMNGRPLPFDLTLESLAEMEDKVKAILNHPIQPKQQ